MHLRRELLNWQRRQVLLVQERHFGAGIEDERQPPVAIDGAADRRAESFDEEVLIGDRVPSRQRDPREGDVAAAEVELETELLQQMRA